MDSEDDDYQLQLALALSMAGDDLDPSQFQQLPAASVGPSAAPPVVTATAPASQGAGTPSTDLAAALAAAFQAIAGQAPANGYQAAAQQQQQQQEPAPPPTFSFAPQQPAVPQQRQQQLPTAAPGPAPVPAARRSPPWVSQLGNWWQSSANGIPPAAANSSPEVQQLLQQQQVEIAVGELPAALQVMSTMLQQPLSCPGAGVAGPAGALMLTCVVASGSGRGTVTAAYCDNLISSWISRAAAGRGSHSHLQLLNAAFQRTPNPSDLADEAVRKLVLLLGLRLAAKAVKLLENDEDDLFFDTGRTTQEMLRALRSATGSPSPAFLSAMQCCCTTPSTAACWSRIMNHIIQGFGAYKFTGGVTELEPLMAGLDRVTQDPIMLRQLAHSLAAEAVALPPAGAPQQLVNMLAPGHAKKSILAPLLNLSSAPDALLVLRALHHQQAFFRSSAAGADGMSGGAGKVSAAAAAMSPATGLFTCLRSYPTNYGEIDGAKRLLEGLLGRVCEAMHQVAKRLAAFKAPDVGSGAGREVLLSWLAAVAAVNEARCKGGEYSALKYLWGAPDGFILNLTAVVLRLTKPFTSGYLTQNPKFKDLFSKHLSPDYYNTHSHRLGTAAAEATLSGQRGVPSSSSGSVPPRPAAPAAAGSSSSGAGGMVMASDLAAAAAGATFIAEVFFICQRYFHVGLLPAVYRFQKLYQHLWDAHSDAAAQAAAAQQSLPGHNRQAPAELTLVHNCYTSQLLQPDFTADAVQFAVLEIVWLADLLTTGLGSSSSSSGGGVLGSVPESVLADAASWLTFVIQQGQSEQLAAVPIGLLMHSLVTLLEHPAEVCSLLVVAKLVQLLLVMLAPQVNLERRTRGALGRSNLSPGEVALVASVLGTSVTQQQLVPALMRVYGQADFVVGLDVDVDTYDKFGMRHQIDQILEELWRDERCRAGIKQQAAAAAAAASDSAAAGGTPGPFTAFISAVLNDLMYLFKDSLERLADIKQIEDSKADTKVWDSLAPDARQDKENFYRGQQRTAAGFMSMAKGTLELLTTLTADADIARTFLVQPLLSRTAYAVLHFLELLVGPRCQDLAVQNPQRYNFDKHEMLLSMVQLAGQLARHAEFIQALADEPDFEENTLQIAVDLLNASHAYAAADALAAVLQSISNSPGRLKKKARRNAAAAIGDAVDMEGLEGAAAVADKDAEIEALVARWLSGNGAGPTTYDAAEQTYKELLDPLSVGVFEATAAGAYNSQFAAMAAQPEGDNSQKLRRLGRELRDLRGKTRLPVQAAAACFVRQDTERPDKVRCIITGPQDTPYEGGLFVFDVYFPPGYPNVPPLMVLETTGQGRARFNPNLYADGKVCLSLLGTWHGSDESSKWNPSTSSLFQILLSIQGMIFVEDPYFNEPQVELMKGTTEGNITSMRYNVDLRLQTLRWAVLDMLRKPPAGLEDVVTNHFRVLRGVLVSRAGRWLHDAAAADPSGTTYKRLVDVMGEITEALAALGAT